MDRSKAHEQLWTSLITVDRYVATGLVEQIGSSSSFGGEDMRPVIEAYWVANTVRPFLEPSVMEAVDHAFGCLETDLNACLGVLQRATSATPPPYAESVASLEKAIAKCSGSFRESLRAIEMRLREAARLEMEKTSVQTNFYGTISGTVNLGTIIGNIASHVTTLRGNTQTHELAESIQGITQAVKDNNDLPDATRQEVLQNVQTLSKQAALPDSEREPGVFRAALKYIPILFSSTVSGIKIWETFGPSIERFFANL